MSSPANDMPIVAMRREQLRRWINEFCDGSQAKFVTACANRGHEMNPGELSALLKTKSFGEKKARSIEESAGMPYRHLDGSFNLPDSADQMPRPSTALRCVEAAPKVNNEALNAIERLKLALSRKQLPADALGLLVSDIEAKLMWVKKTIAKPAPKKKKD